MKTALSAKIFETQRFLGELKLYKLFLQRKKTAEFGDRESFVKLSNCTVCEIFVE